METVYRGYKIIFRKEDYVDEEKLRKRYEKLEKLTNGGEKGPWTWIRSYRRLKEILEELPEIKSLHRRITVEDILKCCKEGIDFLIEARRARVWRCTITRILMKLIYRYPLSLVHQIIIEQPSKKRKEIIITLKLSFTSYFYMKKCRLQ